MTLHDFQEWTREQDQKSKWNNITRLQLVSHLVEEVGEMVRSVNRTYEYRGEISKEHQENLKTEIVDSLWFIFKIANSFQIDIENELSSFKTRASSWPDDKFRSNLKNGLSAINLEIKKAKENLEID